MPLELLRELAQKTFPLTVDDPTAIDKLRVLRAAGHVAVLLPPPGAEQNFARVLVVTPEGRAALEALQSEDGG